MTTPTDETRPDRDAWHRRYGQVCFECHEPWPCASVGGDPQPDTADRALAAELSRAHARISTLEWLLRTAGVPAPHPQGGTEALRALSEAATPGEWRSVEDSDGRWIVEPRQGDIRYRPVATMLADPDDPETFYDAEPDAALIAAAVNYVRALLAAAPAPSEACIYCRQGVVHVRRGPSCNERLAVPPPEQDGPQ